MLKLDFVLEKFGIVEFKFGKVEFRFEEFENYVKFVDVKVCFF